MEYLKTLLGIKAEYKPVDNLHLPNFIVSRYQIRKAVLDGVVTFFLYPVTEMEAVGVSAKRIFTA